MDFELKARTSVGARMVELAEQHAADFATRAEQHDRDNTYVAENFGRMKESGLLAAAAPAEHGGLGVESVHDITVAISRLACGRGATAISANMHIGAVWAVARAWRQSIAAGDPGVDEGIGRFLPLLGRSQVVLSGAGTESGNSFVFPQTEATPVEGGYLVNGHKIFATNSEIADSVTVILRVVDGDWYRSGTAIVLRGSKGMEVRGNWDALGMRGSGSHDIVFTDCFVPTEMMLLGNPLGAFSADGWPTVVAVNFPLVGAFLGIAEAARDLIVETATTKRKKPFDVLLSERPAPQFQVAEIEIGLSAARATLDRTGAAIHGWLERPDSEFTTEDVRRMMSDWQCTKLVVNRVVADVVDRAMALSGGLGDSASNPLSRLYRDVWAGPFMQPLSPNEAFEYIGRVALGLDPDAELHDAIERLRRERES